MAKVPLTNDMIERVVMVLRCGVTYTEAAAVIGVARSTLSSWIKRGKLIHERGRRPKPSEMIYVTLYQQVVQAQHDAHILLAAQLMNAAINGQTKVERRVTTHPDGSQTTTVITTQEPPSLAIIRWILARRYSYLWSENADLYQMIQELRKQIHDESLPGTSLTEGTAAAPGAADEEDLEG